MAEKPYKWEKRTEDWIKENPGKGTMFKRYFNNTDEKAEVIKEERTKVYPIMKDDFGVYAIICDAEKCVYVGQSQNMNVRIRSHKMSILGPSIKKGIYVKIKEHCEKHGPSCLEFKKILRLPEGSKIEDLLIKEDEIMAEFLQKGYTLYNFSVNNSLYNDHLHCPKDYKSIILKTIDKLASETDFINKLNKLLNEK